MKRRYALASVRLAAGLVLGIGGLASPVPAQCMSAVLTEPVPVEHGDFGDAVATDGQHLVAAVQGERRVHVFERVGDAWLPVQVLESPGSLQTWGKAVAVDGACLFVGYPSGNAVLVFEHDGTEFVPVQVLGSSSYIPRFGETLAVDGDRLLVGARDHGFGPMAFVYQW